MSGHTPGPWHVIDGGKHWNNPVITNYRIHAPSGERGFDVAWSDAGELVVEHVYEEADARLIAAAPDGLDAGRELLGVVKAAIASGDWKVDGACDPDMAIRRMEAFIAKATGADA